MERNLTGGSVPGNVARFALPYLLSYLLQTFYGMADLFITGRFCGVEATTAVSMGSQLMHMLTVVTIGLAMGSTVRIARAVGAEQREDEYAAVGNTITLFLAVSAALTAVLLLSVNGIVGAMSTPAEAAPGAAAYLTICFAGVPFITAYNIISSIFRGMGDSKSPMWFVLCACVINVLLDLLFIGGMGMGPTGAALGTVLAQTCSVAFALAVIAHRRLLPGLKRYHLRPRRGLMLAILRVGGPVAAQDGFIQISFLIITKFANMRGLADAAAVGIVEKLIGIMFLVPSSMLSTVSALAAQNIGAGRHDRARQTLICAIVTAICAGIVFTIAMQFASEWAVGLFTTDARAITLGGQYMRSYVVDCVLAGVHFCFSGWLCAYGLSGISFLHNMASILLARIPLAYIMSVNFPDTLTPMGFAAPAGSLVSVIICVAAFIWLNRRPERLDAAAGK